MSFARCLVRILTPALAALLTAASFAGVWEFAPKSLPHDLAAAAVERVTPVAAFAWAQNHCNRTLALTAGGPTIVADRLLSDAAILDEQRDSFGTARACAQALRLAASLIDGPLSVTDRTDDQADAPLALRY